MAYEIPGFKLTLVAGEDLGSDQYKFVKQNASGQAVKCSAITDKPVGILQNNPASGGEAEIMCDGVSKLKFGGAAAIGALVGTDASAKGDAIVAGTDTTVYAVGQVLDEAAAADGDIVSVLFDCKKPSRAA
jgi:hypothetical protein